MPKVLITDNVAAEGIDLLKKHVPVDVKRGLSPDELIATIPGYDALVVRSETRVTEPVISAGCDLKVVARAGIGVDNIDLDAATRAGVAVVNAPIGNTVAAAEHTVALMLALARNVPQAYASMKEGQWQRSAFMGIEVRNKTLGIVGLGRVGSEVARRAASFGMRLIAYDPFVAPDFAARMGVAVMSLDEVLDQADFITLHTPLTAGTTNLISAPQLAKMKPGARLINVARGELVDDDALLEALESEHLAGAALDVFTNEPPGDLPLLKHPRLVATPHLGASTQEAQREVAIEAAEQVLAVLEGKPARNTVNAPFVPPEVHAILAPYVPVASMVGRLLTSMARGQFVGVTLRYQGEIAEHNTAILKAAALVGLLGQVSGEAVNMINAPVLAQQRGLQVTEQTSGDSREYASLITATSAHHRRRHHHRRHLPARRAAPGARQRLLDGRCAVCPLHAVRGQSGPTGHHRGGGHHGRPPQHQHQLHGGGPHRPSRSGDDGCGSRRPHWRGRAGRNPSPAAGGRRAGGGDVAPVCGIRYDQPTTN